MEFTFANVAYLHLLWVIPALGLVYWYGFARRRRALARFAATSLLGHLMPGVSTARQKVKAVLVLAGMAVLIFALSGPRWGEQDVKVYRRGVDLMVVLDISRSMLGRRLPAQPTRKGQTVHQRPAGGAAGRPGGPGLVRRQSHPVLPADTELRLVPHGPGGSGPAAGPAGRVEPG